jgi:thioredoxin
MKRQIILCLFALTLGVSACQQNGNNNNKDNTANIATTVLSVDEFEKKMASYPDVQLIDVRTPKEYERGHLPGAKNIDVNGDDFEGHASALDKDRPVFVYCKSGHRSAEACTKLADMGFKNVHGLDGGIEAWGSAGKSVIQSAVSNTGTVTQEDVYELANQKKYVLVDYNATWCGPCKKMIPILDKLVENRMDSLLLVKIDADENHALMEKKQVSSIPYLELYKDGKLVWTYTGMISEEGIIAETDL